MKFLKVHYKSDKRTIKLSNVCSIQDNPYRDDIINYNEPKEEYEYIEASINFDNITMVTTDDENQTLLFLKNGNTLTIKEKYDDILKILEKN